MRPATQEQKDAAEQRRTKFRTLARQLSAMPKAQRDALAARLSNIGTVEGRTLSTINQCLIAAQCPSATLVGGFKQWKKAGRSVKKGEHGISIWVPFAVKTEAGSYDNGVRFGAGVVFDVAQTEELRREVKATTAQVVADFIDPTGTMRKAGMLEVVHVGGA